jgi:hypothetical protein
MMVVNLLVLLVTGRNMMVVNLLVLLVTGRNMIVVNLLVLRERRFDRWFSASGERERRFAYSASPCDRAKHVLNPKP